MKDDTQMLTGRDRHIACIAMKRGLSVLRHGLAWRVVGFGVDILVSRLSNLNEVDLLPSRDGH